MPNYNSTLQTNNSSLEEIITQLNNMPDAGGTDTSDATATSGDILSGKTAYVNGEKVTGNIATRTSSNLTANGATVTVPSGYYSTQATKAVSTATQATPSISINSSTGLITASATQTAGYVTAGTKSATSQLAFKAATTITPGTTNQTAVAANTYVGGAITVKGDANLVASNIVSGKSIFGVVGTATAGGGSGGDTSMEDGLIDGSLTTYTNDRVTTIRRNAFYFHPSLTSVNFPVCTSIGQYAFQYCSRLTSVNFPVCTSINSSAFQYCSRLTSVNFPKVKAIGYSAFQNCTSLTSVNFPVCTSINSSAFQNCTSLTSVNFPVCTSIPAHGFYNCTQLTSVNFPKASNIDSYAFYNCSRLTSVSFPLCTEIGGQTFYNCSRLTSVSFPLCTKIYGSAFAKCSKLTSVSFPVCTNIVNYAFDACANLVSIYLGASTVCTLSNSLAFGATAITSTTGSIFVPASLVSAYKSATNWTFFSARIFSYNFT